MRNVMQENRVSDEIQASTPATFLLTGLAWQESLLQSYRNYLLGTQSIFMAVNVGLLSAQANSTDLVSKTLFFLPFLVITFVAYRTLILLPQAVSERATSVDWWQKRLLRFEKAEDETRHFTTYRVAKEHEFNEPTIEARQLSEEQINSLLRPRQPRARKVFDVFVPGFQVLWATLLGSACVDYVYFLIRLRQ
jgi:hypothetical protein